MSSPSSISPERWQQIIDAFHAVTDADPADRDAVLDELCSGDPDLRASVQRLLDADAEASVLVPTAAGTRLSMEQTAADGQHVGPYQLQGEIGRGGMGVVYRATRADVGNTVAVKMLREQFPSKERTERFVREQHVLGQLEHPGIARFLDAGVTEDETPYLVMEYVDGQPVTDAAHGMDLRERLQLFLDICAAVRYAHRNLVVHRDLKPSNVLVTGDGTVKLLDFGIAKVLEEDATITATRHRVMTLAYAAPEQVEGGTVSTATDVYALGILLYELLTGHRPLDLDDLGFPEAVRRILHETPTAPSSRGEATSPDGVSAAALRGDLDTICLKALRKEPERRYESVDALRVDIQRYLSDRPITARPDSLSYRTTKFVRRNRASVVAAGLAFLVLSAVLTFYTTRLADERDRATAQAELAESVVDFLLETLDEGNPNAVAGDTLTVFEIIDRAEERTARFDQQPIVHASLLDAIGRVRLMYGSYPKADSLCQRGLEQRSKALPINDPALAVSYNRLANVRLEESNPDAADSLLTLAQNLYAQQAPPPTLQATTLGLQARAHLLRKNHAVADSLLKAAIELARMELSPTHRDLANLHADLGRTQMEMGELDAAQQTFESTLLAFREAHPNGHTILAGILSNLAIIHRSRGEYSAADSLFVRSAAMMRDLVGENHLYLASIATNRGVNDYVQGDFESAHQHFLTALRIRINTLGESNPEVAGAQNNAGAVSAQAGMNAEAEKHFREAHRIYASTLGESNLQTLVTYSNIAGVLEDQGKLRDALPMRKTALEKLKDTLPAGHTRLASAHRDLGNLLKELDQHEEAEKHLLTAQSLRQDALPAMHPELASVHEGLGDLYLRMEEWEKAEDALRTAVEIRSESTPDHPSLGHSEVLLGKALGEQGESENALALFTEGYAHLQNVGAPSAMTEEAREVIGAFHQRWKQPASTAMLLNVSSNEDAKD